MLINCILIGTILFFSGSIFTNLASTIQGWTFGEERTWSCPLDSGCVEVPWRSSLVPGSATSSGVLLILLILVKLRILKILLIILEIVSCSRISYYSKQLCVLNFNILRGRDIHSSFLSKKAILSCLRRIFLNSENGGHTVLGVMPRTRWSEIHSGWLTSGWTSTSTTIIRLVKTLLDKTKSEKFK